MKYFHILYTWVNIDVRFHKLSQSHFTDVGKVTQSRTSKAAFLVPFDKDDKFVGREDILSKIDERLKNKRRVAIAGIGGVG